MLWHFVGFINLSAQEKVVPLYSVEIPNSKKTPINYQETRDTVNGYFTKISIPPLTVFTPKKGTKNRTAVTIFPNGGYRVVVDKGDDIVKAFTDKGITTFVLKYHLPIISFAHAKVEATITKLLRSNPSENALSLR